MPERGPIISPIAPYWALAQVSSLEIERYGKQKPIHAHDVPTLLKRDNLSVVVFSTRARVSTEDSALAVSETVAMRLYIYYTIRCLRG